MFVTKLKRCWSVLCFCLGVLFLAPSGSLADTVSFTALRLGTSGPENYVFTHGQNVVPVAQVDSNAWYKIIIRDPSGTVLNPSFACTSGTAFSTNDNGYSIQPSDPLSTTGPYTFTIEEFADDTCSGAITSAVHQFYVASAVASVDGFFSGETTNRFAVGQTAFVRVDGLPAETANWSVTWITPTGAISCANTAGADRPLVDGDGVLPSASSFLAYQPNSNPASEVWNQLANYDASSTCQSFALTNQGPWRLRLQLNPSNFVVLPVFVLSNDCTAPVIFLDPESKTVCAGTPVSFSVFATGTNITYRWRKNGVNLSNGGGLSGTTTDTLNISAPNSTNAGDYDVLIVGDCGSVTSAVAALTVNLFSDCSISGATNVCANSVGNTFSAPSGMAGYLWQVFGGGTISGPANESNVAVNVTSPGTFTLSLTFTNNSGCATNCSRVISVTQPTAVVSGNATICAGSNATIQAVLSGTAPWTVVWSDGVSQSNIFGSPITRSVSPASTTTFTITNLRDASCLGNWSGSASVTVNQPPTVSTNPVSRAVCIGGAATFTAAASGTAPITIQWQVSTNGGASFTNIAGATNGTLTVSNTSLADSGKIFRARFQNGCGTAVSSNALLTVLPPPACSISGSNPVCANSSGNIFSAPAGMASYGWTVSGNATVSSPANGQTLSINTLGAGTFTLTLSIVNSNGCSSVCSRTFTNRTIAALVSGNATNCPGSPVVLTATLTGFAPWTLVWSDGFVQSGITTNVATRVVSPTNNTAYTLTSVSDANCTSTNVSGSATITLNSVPVVTLNPTNRAVCSGASGTFVSRATANPSPAVRWQFSSDGGITYSNIAGATTTNYTFTAAASQNGNFYRAIFSNACGTATSAVAVLTVNAVPLVAIFADDPVCTASTGNMAAISNAPAGATFVWSITGGAITAGQGTTNITYSATGSSVQLSVVVTSPAGCSATVNRTVAVVSGGTGIEIEAWQNTISNPQWNPSTLNSHRYSEGMSIPFRVILDQRCSGEAWCVTLRYDFAIGDKHFLDSLASYDASEATVLGNECFAQTCNSPPTTYPIPTDGSLPPGAQLPGNFTVYNGTITNVSGYTMTTASGAEVKLITVSGVTAGGGTKDVIILFGGHLARENEWGAGNGASSFPGAQAKMFYKLCGAPSFGNLPIDPRAIIVQSDTAIGKSSAPNPACVSNLLTYTLKVTNFGPNLMSGLIVTDTLPPGVTFFSSVPSAALSGSNLIFSLGSLDAGMVTNLEITVRISNTAPSVLTNVARVTLGTSDPRTFNNVVTNLTQVNRQLAFALQSGNLALCAGSQAAFSVMATGSPPILYQWFHNGMLLPGATNTAYSIPGVTAGDAGNYFAVASGPCNVATSSVAVVIVKTNISATPLPSTNLCEGGAATFGTVISGPGPHTIVWRKDGAIISGQTSTNLTISPVTPADAATYTIEISGACNSVTNSATLTVYGLTTATPLANRNVCPSNTVTFVTVPGGTGPFVFIWFHDSALIPDATNNTLVLTNVSATNGGIYTVVVSGRCNSVTNSATLAIGGDGTASALQDVVACPGQRAEFATVVSGAGPFAFTWRKDGMVITGGIVSTATNSTLVISNVMASDAGTYSVEVAGACNGGGSAVLMVKTNTTSTPLADLTICPGDTAIFATTPSGTGPFSFVWRKDGTELGGETNAVLILSNVTVLSAGIYSVEVTGNCNTVTNLATLVVGVPPTITPLLNVTSCPNAIVTFSTSVTGLEPVAFLWRKDGMEIPGATNATLVLSNISGADGGIYTVQVNDRCGAATNSALLVVREPTTATPLGSQTVCAGATATFGTIPAGAGPFTFVWRKDGAELIGETNSSLSVPSVGTSDAGVYSVEVEGACNAVTNSAGLTVNELTTATPLASIAKCEGDAAFFSSAVSGTGPFTFVWRKDGLVLIDETNAVLSIPSVSSNSVGIYTLEVYGACNAVTNTASLTLNAPTTASALENQTVCAGSTVVFATIANGSGPFSYTWLKDGALLNDETNSSLIITNVTGGFAGIYSVEVSGACGSVTNSAQLFVTEIISATPLTDLAVCAGGVATFDTLVTGLGPLTFVWRKDAQLLVGETNASLTIDPVTEGNAGTYSVEVSGACNTITNNATLTVLSATTATPLMDMAHCVGETAMFGTTPGGSGPFTFVWRKNGGLLGGETNNSLSFLVSSTDDAGIYAVEVTGQCNSVTNTAALTISDLTTAGAMSNEVRCIGGSVTFTAVPVGTGPFTYAWRKATNYLMGATNITLELVNLTTSDAGVYTVEISGACNTASASATLNVSTQPNATALTNQTRCVAASATFSTTVSGIGPFTYVWRKGTNAIPGAFTSSLTLTNLRTTDAGTYSVEVTGGCGTLTNSATLTLLARVSATPLATQNRCIGANATFTTLASGAGPFTYRWRKDGVLLPGRTNSNTTITNVGPSDAGLYSVEITGQCNTFTNSATLTVSAIPVVTGLTNQIVCPGVNAVFTAQVTGAGNFTYVWRRNGFVLTGQNTNTLTVTSVNSSKTGTYSLEVNSTCRNVTNSATLNLKTNVTIAAMTNQTQCEGRAVTFVANVAGTGPFSFQWQKDNTNLLTATNSSYTIPSVTVGSAGTYTIFVTGECSTTNRSVVLTVNPGITATPLQDATICEGGIAQFSTTVSGGGAPYQFVWRHNGAVLAGQTNNTIQFSNALPVQSGTYSVEITGCEKITNTAVLTVRELVRASMETNKLACSCSDLILGPVVTGSGPLSYVWRKDGVLLQGETNISLNLGKLIKTSPGVYQVEITGPCNSTTNRTTVEIFEQTSGQFNALTPVTIPSVGPASPYPTRILVQCAPKTASELSVSLYGLSHTFPDDLDILLVAPNGRAVKLMSDAGGGNANILSGVDLTFTDGASDSLSNNTLIVSGVYKPTDFVDGADVFPAPATAPNAVTIQELLSSDPNGYWSLYIMDDHGPDGGSLVGGWNLNFGRRDYIFLNVTLTEPTMLPAGGFQMRLNGEPNTTYYLEASSNLQTWDVIQTNVLNGVSMPLTDATAAQFNYRFYRVSGCRE